MNTQLITSLSECIPIDEGKLFDESFHPLFIPFVRDGLTPTKIELIQHVLDVSHANKSIFHFFSLTHVISIH